MKVGDRVMLVSYGYPRRRLRVSEDNVKAVHKNGLIILEGRTQKYRENGSPTGSHGYHPPPHLQPWDDALWQEYQRQQANAVMASKLHRFIEIIRGMHDDEKEAEIWQALPYEIRKLVETDQ